MPLCFVFFFFSSRRRHTRSLCDWSSDVCSSDLIRTPTSCRRARRPWHASRGSANGASRIRARVPPPNRGSGPRPRSEERRVGKEGGSRGGAEQERRKRRQASKQEEERRREQGRG